MIERLELNPLQCSVMEGCVTDDRDNFVKFEKKDNIFTFMYSGKVDVEFGIMIAVEAFYKIKNPNCRFVISGEGDASNKVREFAKKDRRIQYIGFVEDYRKVKQMQYDADVLLNMRLPSNPASKYCFPSKLFEYMKTGNPVLSFKIKGIPEEYYDYLLFVEEESIDSFYKAMISAMEMSERERTDLGKKAKEFILTYKNINIQTEKIYNLVEK